MTAKGPCWNVYSQAVSHFLGKHSNRFLMEMYSWGAVSDKKTSFRKHWSIPGAPTGALPQCHTRRIYWIKRALTLLWYVSAVCPRWQIRLEPRTPSADLSLTPGLSLGQGRDASFLVHACFSPCRMAQLNLFAQRAEKVPEKERMKQLAVCCCFNCYALVQNISDLDIDI